MKKLDNDDKICNNETKLYQNLASRPLTVDCHTHPLIFFAFSGYILYTSTETNTQKENLDAQFELYKNVQQTYEKCRRVCLYLTIIVKVNSCAGRGSGAHVTVEESSCHFCFLTRQGFCLWCANQQPAIDAHVSPAPSCT